MDTKNYDVIGITETWLSTDVLDTKLPLNNFNIYHYDRSKTGGGVLLAVRKTL